MDIGPAIIDKTLVHETLIEFSQDRPSSPSKNSLLLNDRVMVIFLMIYIHISYKQITASYLRSFSSILSLLHLTAAALVKMRVIKQPFFKNVFAPFYSVSLNHMQLLENWD